MTFSLNSDSHALAGGGAADGLQADEVLVEGAARARREARLDQHVHVAAVLVPTTLGNDHDVRAQGGIDAHPAFEAPPWTGQRGHIAISDPGLHGDVRRDL